MVKLTVILAECAVERVPKEILKHPSVIRHAQNSDKKPEETVLDRSYHHSAITRLMKSSSAPIDLLHRLQKTGRPDILHFTLLNLLGTPLNKAGRLAVYAHNLDGNLIRIEPKVRLPRNYERFVGLIEQLYSIGRVPPEGELMLTIKKSSFETLMAEVKATLTIALSRKGRPTDLREAVERLAATERPAIIIGGFPRGDFTRETLRWADEVLSISKVPLDAWTVAARLVYEFERAIRLHLT